MRRPVLLALLLAAAACAPGAPPLRTPASQERPRAGPADDAPRNADFLRVRKGARLLEVWSAGRLLYVVPNVQLGREPVGPKRFEGDGRTPEGRYVIDWRNPRSAYHLSLHVSYPDAHDTDFAASRGRSAGGMIMIHGQPNGRGGRVEGDWTDGCIAVADHEIEALWEQVPDGTAIEIIP